ncbi:hypothetical protein SKAU_G00324170 [Synaphobranchus kaupii]|uniref:Uncharacterized protein n=1 Tax=Synaphobranchus kaupii TaxID=118154 RepID=A0A9Q1EPD2_SYNKA|nr:hypothetical protein SKAU_G00324170 [Synaphobranchus kaupii]
MCASSAGLRRAAVWGLALVMAGGRLQSGSLVPRVCTLYRCGDRASGTAFSTASCSARQPTVSAGRACCQGQFWLKAAERRLAQGPRRVHPRQGNELSDDSPCRAVRTCCELDPADRKNRALPLLIETPHSCFNKVLMKGSVFSNND